MIDTRRLYKLEGDMYCDRRYSNITKQRPYKFLLSLAKKIWKKENIKSDMPQIRFGIGTPHGGVRYSWCDGETIELVKTQRDILTLIHELVHGMGFDYHDKKFVRKEMELLNKYTDINEELIIEAFESYDYH
jgi:hypothetical protein